MVAPKYTLAHKLQGLCTQCTHPAVIVRYFDGATNELLYEKKMSKCQNHNPTFDAKVIRI